MRTVALVVLVLLLLGGCILLENKRVQEQPPPIPVISSPMIPTSLNISAEKEALVGEQVLLYAVLSEKENGTYLMNKKIFFFGLNGEEMLAYTNASGVAVIEFSFNESGIYEVVASFNGFAYHEESKSQPYRITVSYEQCGDGTKVGECSTLNPGYYCNYTKELLTLCSLCACEGKSVCYRETCMSESEREERAFDDMLDSVVYVEHSLGSGSGVIIEQHIGEGGNYTVILSNRHVVDGAIGVSDIQVSTNDERGILVNEIRMAPHDMDLVLLFTSGVHGVQAKFSDISECGRGDSVFVVGSPLGLQNSVSGGIVSNFVTYVTDSNYFYTAIQTDAEINPGNSGGGLFLAEDQTLAGIVTFKYGDFSVEGLGVEGLGFAIQIDEFSELPDYTEWESLSPSPKCWDGTPYGSCSQANAGYFCSGYPDRQLIGTLIADCSHCGCEDKHLCISEGEREGECFFCPEPWVAYTDGTCCEPGKYRVGFEKCCPVGKSVGVDGICH